MQATGNVQKTPATIVIVGGVVAIIGTLLNWVTLGGTGVEGGEETEKGLDATAGLGTLVFAVIIIILGLVMWLRGRQNRGRGQAIAAFVLAIFALLASAFSAFAPEDAVQSFESGDVADQLGISEAQAEAAIESAFADGTLTAEAEIGTYVATFGSILLLVGSFMGMRAGKGAAAGVGGAGAAGRDTPMAPGAGAPGPTEPPPGTAPGGPQAPPPT